MRVIDLDEQPTIVTLKIDGILVSYTTEQLRSMARGASSAHGSFEPPLRRRSKAREKKLMHIEKLKEELESLKTAASSQQFPDLRPFQTKGARSLASVSMQVAKILAVSPPDEHKLLKALNSFDGDTSGRRTSQLGHQLKEALDGMKLLPATHGAIRSFLLIYPNLLTISRS